MRKDHRGGRVASCPPPDDDGWAPPRLATAEYVALDPSTLEMEEKEQSELSLLTPLESLEGFYTAMIFSPVKRQARSVLGGRATVDHEMLAAVGCLLALDDTEQVCLTRQTHYVFTQKINGLRGDVCVLVLERERGNFGLARMKLEKISSTWTTATL